MTEYENDCNRTKVDKSCLLRHVEILIKIVRLNANSIKEKIFFVSLGLSSKIFLTDITTISTESLLLIP